MSGSGRNWKYEVIAYRKRHLISQSEMAKRCGVSVMTINSIENDTASPSMLTETKLERVLRGDVRHEAVDKQD